MNANPIYIFDLDGTIALIDHRRPILSDPSLSSDQRWRRFFAACVGDTPNLPVIETMRLLQSAGAEIFIFSGRSDEVAKETFEWLARYKVPGPRCLTDRRMFMRPCGDMLEDSALKSIWFDTMAESDQNRVVAVFDDRDAVVAMWWKRGIPCFQVARGNF
jgi:hypothetical protein